MPKCRINFQEQSLYLANFRAAVLGIGGYTVEALVRSGIGQLTLSMTIRYVLQISTVKFTQYEKRWVNIR